MDNFDVTKWPLKTFLKFCLIFLGPIFGSAILAGLIVSYLKTFSIMLGIIMFFVLTVLICFWGIKYIFKQTENDQIWNWILK